MASTSATINAFYEALKVHFGPQDWWPGDTPFEVMVGAILTQNTNWRNVEKAIANLKANGPLEPRAVYDLPLERLAELIRPSGYYNVKAARLRNLLAVLVEDYGADLERFFAGDVESLQERLLAVKGVGRETADSIILYAAGKPTFVVDAYTARIAARHGLIFGDVSYEELKCLFEENLPVDSALYNEYHALIVLCGKNFCKRTAPRCGDCPLDSFPHAIEEF